MFFSFFILKPMPPPSRASLDLVDQVVHTENVPGVPFGHLITVKKKENKDGKKRTIIRSEQSYLATISCRKLQRHEKRIAMKKG
jgi:hypothetical protein